MSKWFLTKVRRKQNSLWNKQCWNQCTFVGQKKKKKSLTFGDAKALCSGNFYTLPISVSVQTEPQTSMWVIKLERLLVKEAWEEDFCELGLSRESVSYKRRHWLIDFIKMKTFALWKSLEREWKDKLQTEKRYLQNINLTND